MGRIKTVNVVYITSGIEKIHSYEDTPEGNKLAEEDFITSIKKVADFDDNDIDSFLMDGYFSHFGDYADGWSYEILIFHSSL